MAELLGFPMLSQLTKIAPAGETNVNAPFACVYTSILAASMWLLGIKEMNAEYDPQAVIDDSVYGRNWTNKGTDASAFIPWCAQHGIKLSSVPTVSYADAVSRAHRFLAESIPVIFTQQDDYAPLQFRSEWTHVCAFHKDAPGTLIAMDPYIAEDITYSDAVWAQRLRSTELWIVEKVSAAAPKEATVTQPISLSTPRVGDFYEQAGAMWRCKFAYNAATRKMEPSKNGALVGNAILTFYRGFGGNALNGLTYLMLAITPETKIVEGAVAQVFEGGIVVSDPKHLIANPVGSGDIYVLSMSSKIGQSILQHVFGLADAAQTKTLQNQLDALTTTNKHISDDNQLLTTHVQELTAQINELSKQTPTVQLQAELAQALARLNQIEELAKI